MNWQPITSAPKDGTELLFWCGLVDDCGSHQMGVWFDYDGGGKWETLDGVALEGTFHPTHWMYPPEPPVSTEYPPSDAPQASTNATDNPVAPEHGGNTE